MQNDKTPMKENLILSSKTIYTFTLGPAISFLRFLSKYYGKKKKNTTKCHVYKPFHDSLVCNSKNPETTNFLGLSQQIPTKWDSWLQTIETYYVIVLKARNLNSRCCQGHWFL